MSAVLARVRPLLPHLAREVDELATRIVPMALLALWPLAYGVALGASAFAWTHPSWRRALDQNRVPSAESLGIVGWTACGLVFVLAIYAWAIARSLRPLPPGAPTEAAPRRARMAAACARCRERLRLSLALPIAVALAGPGVESDGPATAMALSTLAAAVVAVTLYRWPARGPSDSAPSPALARFRVGSRALAALARHVAPVLLVGLMGWFIALLGRLTLIDYRGLHAHTIDLGLYDNILWHSAHHDWLGSSFLLGGHHSSAHFDPILIALAPVYALRPRADTLLVLQVVWVASALVPLYRLASDKLGDPLCGLAFAAMYAAHPAVHGAALYEFHSLTLAGPLLIWLVYLLERASYGAYALVLTIALLCREDVALLVCFVGLYGILRGGRGRARAGWVTAIACLAYFAVVKRFFMDSPDLLNSLTRK